MLDRFERPIKIICLVMAAWLAWQLGSLIMRGDPLARLKIPALPTLPAATNAPAKPARQETHGTNATMGAKAAKGTNGFNGTNVVKGTNVVAKSTNAPAGDKTPPTNASSGPGTVDSQGLGPLQGMPGLPPGMMAGLPPGMMAQMRGAGMPGGRMGGGMKKIELPPEVQARVDRIIDSEIFGPVVRPMPVALSGLSDEKACIRAANGQTDWVKVGGELGGIKLLRIGVNRVLVEQDGATNELTLFGGIGGESLLPTPRNAPSTNAPSTPAPVRRPPTRKTTVNNTSTTPTLSSKEKETP